MLSLGIDIGTSGVRTMVLDDDSVVAEARADHPAQDPAQIDANRWWQAVAACLHRQMAALKEASRDPAEISGIAVDGTSGSMVLTDAALEAVSPALMYNSKGFDAEASRIAVHAEARHITNGTNSALARALRLVDLAEGPAAHLMHQADFIAAKLMGQGGHSDYHNALKTGFDPAAEAWPAWIGGVIDTGLLPEVHAPGAVLGTVGEQAVSAFKFSPNAKVHAGTTDSIAAFLAAAPAEGGVAVTSLGSTLAVKLLSPVRIDDPAIGLYSHRLGDNWLVGGASNTGGAVLKAQFTDAELRGLSARIDPDVVSALDYYPLPGPGERFPINDPALEPRMTPRPADDAAFLHGLLEAIARIEAQCYREMEARGARWPRAVFTAGGGAQNPTWTAIRARHLGLTPAMARHSEAAFGAATLARGD